MTWIQKTPQAPDFAPEHTCSPPMREVYAPRPPRSLCSPEVYSGPRRTVLDGPDGAVGDVWMCDDCMTVWVVTVHWRYTSGNGGRSHYRQWDRAGWWKSRRARCAAGWV